VFYVDERRLYTDLVRLLAGGHRTTDRTVFGPNVGFPCIAIGMQTESNEEKLLS